MWSKFKLWLHERTAPPALPVDPNEIRLTAVGDDGLGRKIIHIDSLERIAIRTKEGYLVRLWTDWDPSATWILVDAEHAKGWAIPYAGQVRQKWTLHSMVRGYAKSNAS